MRRLTPRGSTMTGVCIHASSSLNPTLYFWLKCVSSSNEASSILLCETSWVRVVSRLWMSPLTSLASIGGNLRPNAFL